MSQCEEYKAGFDVARVRALAVAAGGLEEIKLDTDVRLISFRRRDNGARINVYYATQTVGTAMDHPRAGKTQLFRRNVTIRELLDIFLDPRTHTGRGYYERAELERRDLARQRAEEERKRTEAEAKRRAAAEAEAARRVEQEAGERRQAELRRQRGTRWLAVLDQPQIDAMLEAVNDDVKCFAIEKKAYILIYDDGGMAYWGIPEHLRRRLKGREGQADAPKPVLVALGTNNRYYIKFANGREWFSGSTWFTNCINGVSGVRAVAFGATQEAWVVLHGDGAQWGRDTPEDLKDELRARNLDNIESLAMGPTDWVIFGKNGKMRISGQSAGLYSSIGKLRAQGHTIRAIDFGDQYTWALRYV